MRNIYIAIAIPLSDKDGMLIKFNEKIIITKKKQNTMVRAIS